MSPVTGGHRRNRCSVSLAVVQQDDGGLLRRSESVREGAQRVERPPLTETLGPEGDAFVAPEHGREEHEPSVTPPGGQHVRFQSVQFLGAADELRVGQGGAALVAESDDDVGLGVAGIPRACGAVAAYDPAVTVVRNARRRRS